MNPDRKVPRKGALTLVMMAAPTVERNAEALSSATNSMDSQSSATSPFALAWGWGAEKAATAEMAATAETAGTAGTPAEDIAIATTSETEATCGSLTYYTAVRLRSGVTRCHGKGRRSRVGGTCTLDQKGKQGAIRKHWKPSRKF